MAQEVPWGQRSAKDKAWPAGDAGLLFDPFNAKAIAEALARVIEDSNYRAELGHRGIERARAFKWTTSARLTLEIYYRALRKNNI